MAILCLQPFVSDISSTLVVISNGLESNIIAKEGSDKILKNLQKIQKTFKFDYERSSFQEESQVVY